MKEERESRHTHLMEKVVATNVSPSTLSILHRPGKVLWGSQAAMCLSRYVLLSTMKKCKCIYYPWKC